MFIVLSTSIPSGCYYKSCMSLSNHKCMTQLTLINLRPNEYRQELHYYLFAINLDRCAGSSYIPDDLCNKVCIPNEIEDLNLGLFNMIAEISESKLLAKHTYANVNANLMVENVIQVKSEIMINVNASAKNIIYVKNNIFGTRLHGVAKMVNI